MKHLNKILLATDLSDLSRRGLRYACSLAADERSALTVLHVANEFAAWEYYSDEFAWAHYAGKVWPRDRVLAEANLDLNNFLEQHLEAIKQIPLVTKRIAFGPVAQRIAEVAEDEHADLVVMAPHRQQGLRAFFSTSVTGAVMRLSPCPVLAVTSPLPSRLLRGRSQPSRLGWLRPSAASI
jgi:nucleotide-binding universal stress UspA family protein